MKFKFKIFNDRLTQEEYKNGVSGNVNTYTCNFDIECSYGGLTWFCVFKQGDNVYSVPIIDGECIMPYEVVESKGRIYIGAYGTNTDENNIKRVSTNWLFLRIDEGAYSEGSVPDVPTADAWEVYVNSKVEPLLKEIETSENQRQTAENNRLSAENNRKTAESNRQTAEDGRATAESERATAETQRLNAEANRNSYETERILAETARVEAENTRADAEAQRALSESERQSAEAERVMTELARAEAETARVSAENARVEAEATRAEELAKKADKATTLEGYGIIDAYTKTEVDDKDNAIKSDIEALKQKSIPHTTASDYPLTVTDHLEGEDVINYQVYGNSTQATRSGKNILPYPYEDATKTMSGITFTDNGDGTITVNGTSTGDAIFTLCTANIFDKTKKYFLSGNPNSSIAMQVVIFDTDDNSHSWGDEGDGIAIDLSELGDLEISSVVILLTVVGGVTLSNVVIKPQIEEGTTATEYEQYGVMPSPDYPSEIQSVGDLVTDETSEYYGKYDVPVTVCGKNLLDYTKATAYSGGNISFFENGFTFTGKYYVSFNCDNIVVGNVYVLSWNYQSSDILTPKWRLLYTDGAFSNTLSNGEAITINKKVKNILIYPEMTSAIHTTTFTNIQLEKGSSATEYEPYKGKTTKHIYLNEPLRKVGDYADYVDWGSQKVVRNIRNLDMGELSYRYYSSGDAYPYGYFVARSTNTTDFRLPNSKVVCEIYNSSISSFKTDKTIFSTSTSSIYIVDSDYTSGDEIKYAVTGQKIYIIRATPTEEPITVPELTTPNSAVMNVSSGTTIQPSQIDLTYYQDINKVITNLTNAILAQGGNV